MLPQNTQIYIHLTLFKDLFIAVWFGPCAKYISSHPKPILKTALKAQLSKKNAKCNPKMMDKGGSKNRKQIITTTPEKNSKE